MVGVESRDDPRYDERLLIRQTSVSIRRAERDDLMPENAYSHPRPTIGQREAVEVLLQKVQHGHMPHSEVFRDPILKAAARASQMYGTDDARFEKPEQRAFYHGLLTGYAVAVCLMEQQEKSLEESVGKG